MQEKTIGKECKNMLKHRRIVYFGLATLLLGACVGMSNGIRKASAEVAETVQIVKEYEMTNKVDYVEFMIEGSQGEFVVTVQLPDGHRVGNLKGKRTTLDSQENWRVIWGMEKAASGIYTFTITAPQSGYYNLSVDIPLFRDMAGHWGREEVSDYVRRGIVSGYADGTFRPDSAVTGEELAKLLVMTLTDEQPNGKRQWRREFRWRMTNEERASLLGQQEYDLDAAHGVVWSKPYVAAIDDLGVRMLGSLKEPMSRQDVALMIAGVMRLIDDKRPKEYTYKDTSSLSRESQDAISLASHFAIFGGYPDGTFQPARAVTRAEAVKVLSRLESYLTS
jgi:hypothetical protein